MIENNEMISNIDIKNVDNYKRLDSFGIQEALLENTDKKLKEEECFDQ